MAYFTATTEVFTLTAGPEIGGRIDEEARERGPAGTCHAIGLGARRAVCGLDAGGLHLFPDAPWGLGLTADRCSRCQLEVSGT